MNRERNFDIGNGPHSASDIWSAFVGRQSPAEFVRICRELGQTDWSKAVADYIAEIPSMFPGEETYFDTDELACALEYVIDQYLSSEPPTYRLVIGEAGNEQGRIISCRAKSEAGARRAMARALRPYDGDGWGRVEMRRENSEWERV